MLDDIVAILVLKQLFSVLVQLLQHRCCLLTCAVLQDALDHPAAIRVCGQSENLALHTNREIICNFFYIISTAYMYSVYKPYMKIMDINYKQQ